MSKRFFKQIVASFLSLLVLVIVGFGFSRLFKSKPVVFDPRKAEIASLNTFQFESNAFWMTQGDRYFVYSRVTNPNDNWGAKSFDFVFDFVQRQEELERSVRKISGRDYILPRQTKYILAFVETANLSFDSINFQVNDRNVDWDKPMSEEFLNPNLFSITNINLATGTGQIIAPREQESTLFYEFKKDLKMGDKNEDVFNLQSVLAQDREVYPEGQIHGSFDLATYKAVIRFQHKNGIHPQTGIVDYKTREILNQMFGGSRSEAIQRGGFSFDSNLQFGDAGSEVRELQRVLAQDPTVYPEARITGNFDYLLKRALERFQEKHSLRITGEFDTPTRTKLNSILTSQDGAAEIAPGLTAELSFTVFNNSNTSFREVALVGFLCDTQNKVVAVSRNTIQLMSQRNQNVSFSWVHNLGENVKVCPNGLQAYTNVFDVNNIIR